MTEQQTRDKLYAEWAHLHRLGLPQPETLDRFVRAARLDASRWGAAAENAACQVRLFVQTREADLEAHRSGNGLLDK